MGARRGWAAAAVVAGLSAYALGAATVRYELFPYPTLRAWFGNGASAALLETRGRPTAGAERLRALGYVASTFDPQAELPEDRDMIAAGSD